MDSIDSTTLSFGASSLFHTKSSDPLHSVTIYKHKSAESHPSFWFIFYHGGAWRDPNQDHKDGEPLISYLLNKYPDQLSAASVDYSLTRPLVKIGDKWVKDPKGAIHPDFSRDALAGLLEISKHYTIDEFVLAGHSAGAFIATQLFIKPSTLFSWVPSEVEDAQTYSPELLKQLDTEAEHVLSKCTTIFGLEGIFSLPLFVVEDASYAEFVEPAFGKDEHQWENYHVAPYMTTKGTLFDKVPNLQLVIIHSPEDELLSEKIQPVEAADIYKRILGANSVIRETTDGTHDATLTHETTFEIVSKHLNKLL